VVLNLQKHAEPLRSYPNFCRTPFLPNITESKNGLLNLNHSTVYIYLYSSSTLSIMFQMTFVEPLKQLRRTLGVRSNSG